MGQKQLAEQFNIASEYSTHQAQRNHFPGLAALVAQATEGGNHIFFGEPHVNGMMLKQYEMLANNPDVFVNAARNGVRHLALEFPNEFQGKVDNYLAGNISRDEFKNQLFRSPFESFQTPWVTGDAKLDFEEAFIQTIDNAHASGMQVHFADMKSNIFNQNQIPEIVEIENRLLANYQADNKGMTYTEYTADFIANMPPEEKERLQNAVEAHTQQIMVQRLDDVEQYNFLRSRIPANEGIMGVVGSRHLDNDIDGVAGHTVMGIDDYLESEGRKVTSIEVHDRQTQGYVAAINVADNTPPRDPPEYTILVDEQKIYPRGGDRPLYEDPAATPQTPAARPDQFKF